MKKLFVLLMIVLAAIALVACKPESEETSQDKKNIEGSLEDILVQIYDRAQTSDSFKEFAKDGLLTTEITSESNSYYFGKEEIEYESALASEPFMSSIAYSLCLLRVKEGADIEQIKTDIKENVNPMKWVCVGVDADKVIVDHIGDVVVLIMSNEEGKALHDAFLSLKN